MFGILLFKVPPLPDSREITAEKKEREHDESRHDAFPKHVRGIEQRESKLD